ncbi:MAG: decarboxylating 6-phosphogluconate dehydrogenase [Acidobacteria bacterium]|nr:MAG: decarboxylating 6-phosphogluconate dehydrogenase [Acidobacteriota bacterium]
MKLGMVGLGRMGGNMTQRLIEGGHQVVVYDPAAAAVKEAQGHGAEAANSLADMVKRLAAPRVMWVMVPSGAITTTTITELCRLLSKDDVLIDGGNSMYKDSIHHAELAQKRGVHFLDAGTSGGVWGLTVGYCLMVGGEKEIFDRVSPILKTLAPPEGYLYTGPAGSGHFVKMVHNGIEYGMLQAYGEGFEILEKSQYPLDLRAIAHLWNQGSVIRSWLCELAERAFAREAHLDSIRGYVEDSGEGRWTVQAAIDENVPAPVLTLSLLARLRSRQPESFSAKVIAALRNEFGGHAVKKEGAH